MNAVIDLLRRFTIRTRMLGAVGVVLTMFVLVSAAVLLAGAKLRELNQAFMGHSVHELETIDGVKEHLAAMRLAEKQMVIDYEDGVAVLKLREQWQAELKATREGLQSLLQGQEDVDNAVARQALLHLATYEKGLESVLRNMQNGAYDNSRAADRMLAQPKAEIAAAGAAIARIGQLIHAEVAATQADFERTMTVLLAAFAATLVVAIGIVAPLTMLNSRSITVPIAEARSAALAIAGGDLTRTIVPEGRDEASDLLSGLARMQEGLSRLVRDLHQASQQLQTASIEVASGNADLSQRTEQTAGNLQQAASALTQLAATVNQTAHSARTASQLADTASGVAGRGGEVVAQVVSTMDEISASSRRIADIIGTIDGIAFQTNILALNAAVEAARAGEQGRGFAVVASEVRSLAQRSASAAREIKALIGQSVERVESGSRLVAHAGSTMSEIVTSVRQVTDIIGEISAAAGEQSQGVEQVSHTVSQLDQATQQNAALVEQSAAAAESLKDQSRQLATLVSAFRVASEPASVLGAATEVATAPDTPGTYTSPAVPAAPRVVAQAVIEQVRRAPAPVQARARASAASPPSTPSSAPETQAEDGWKSF